MPGGGENSALSLRLSQVAFLLVKRIRETAVLTAWTALQGRALFLRRGSALIPEATGERLGCGACEGGERQWKSGGRS